MAAAYDLVDDFGRHTRFEGDLLVEDTTDTSDRRKPTWTDIIVYRTVGGSYVVWRVINYRVRHSSDTCRRITNEDDIVPATDEHTFICHACNPNEESGEGFSQASRIKLDVYDTPAELIDGLANFNNKTGARNHSEFSQWMLANISEKDEAVNAAWMDRVIA